LNHQEDQGRQGTPRRGADLDAIGREVVDAGLAVHRALGPGLLESVYEACLEKELRLRGLQVARQVATPIDYRGERIEGAYRLDLLIAEAVVIEVKAVEALSRLHEAQLLTYLKLSGLKLGFLMNFNVPLFKHGVRRFSN
jgi:GxxExxY protein